MTKSERNKQKRIQLKQLFIKLCTMSQHAICKLRESMTKIERNKQKLIQLKQLFIKRN
jgi:hypothetical protein